MEPEVLSASLDRLARAVGGTTGSVQLRRGLTDGEIAAHAETLAPLGLPRDLVEVYRWHDGLEVGSVDLFFDAPFPPLEEAIQTYRWLVESDDGVARWSRSWFPAFGTRQLGELVTLTPRIGELAECVWSYHYTDVALTARYDSLRSLIDTTARLWESGLLPANDPSRVRAALPVIASSNPRCFPTGEWLGRARHTAASHDPATWLPDWVQ
jgi:hypothetical protein